MKVYGGHRMYDLFALNYATPSFSIVKQENKKEVCFVASEHAAIFQCVAHIYIEAKAAHGVNGLVLVILAEDETKVKSRITWDAHTDVLAGFCSPKDGHECIVDFKPPVEEGEVGYESIVDAFQNFKTGSFVRVIMVNPLHAKLSRLVLAISCTYNCFDSSWVRKQWAHIDRLWKLHCENQVGLIVGHAFDGDSRRRQLSEDATVREGCMCFGTCWSCA
jgi:hypothetical protein